MAALGLLLRALGLLLPALGLLLAALGELLATLYLAPRREGRYIGSACVRAVHFQSTPVRTTRCRREVVLYPPPRWTQQNILFGILKKECICNDSTINLYASLLASPSESFLERVLGRVSKGILCRVSVESHLGNLPQTKGSDNEFSKGLC